MYESPRSSGEASAIVDASLDGAGLVNGGTFVRANEALAAAFGYGDVGALVGTPWTELYPGAEREYLESQVLPSVRDGQGWRGEVEGVRADGTTFQQVLSIRPAANDRFAWVVRDLDDGSASGGSDDSISERAEPGQERTPSADGAAVGDGENADRTGTREVGDPGFECRLVAETAPVPVTVATAERGIVYSNREAVDLLGADHRREVLGKQPETFVHPEDRDRATRRLRRVIEDREATGPTEYSLVGGDGEEQYGEIAAVPVTYRGESGAYIVVNDATTNRRSQARLRRERRFLETISDVIDDVVYVIDGDGETYLWNETLAETTGYSHEEIDGMHNREFLPEDQQEYAPGLMEAIDSIEDRRVDLDLLTKDGERIPHEFKGTTFEDPATGEVFRCGIARDISARLEYEQRLERYETIVETVDDGVYALDEDLRFSFVNDALCEMLGQSREDLLGTSLRDLFDSDDVSALVDDIHRRVQNEHSDGRAVRGTYDGPNGEFIFETRYQLHPEADSEFRGIVGVLRDVTEREQRKRELETKLDELATLDRINRTLLETTRNLVWSGSREVIERTVCTQLADSTLYQFAWIGERAVDGVGVVPRMTAGDDRAVPTALSAGADGGVVGLAPAEQALRTGEVATVAADELSGGLPEEASTERAPETVATIPLHYEKTVYGVLVVHTEREDAFSDHELEGFDVLGRTVGFIINAVKSHRLLFTDAVVDLEFLVPEDESELGHVAGDLDCELTLTGHVANGSRRVLYVDVEGAPPEDVVAAMADDSRVEQARVISAGDDEGRIELIVSPPSLLHTVSHAGATVRTAVADPRGTRLVAEAPVDANVRDIVEHVRSEYPDAELQSQRDRDREVTPLGRPDGVLEELTDRQREVLETAYRAGYYAWPRGSTAADLAESLGIASSTLHGHLRKAESTILSTLLEHEYTTRRDDGLTTSGEE